MVGVYLCLGLTMVGVTYGWGLPMFGFNYVWVYLWLFNSDKTVIQIQLLECKSLFKNKHRAKR
jgi:hypothetical protein